MNKLSIKFPFIILVTDYHEFKTMQKLFSQMYGAKVKIAEIIDDEIIGCTYQGYVYTDKKYKSKKELKDFIGNNPDRIFNCL